MAAYLDKKQIKVRQQLTKQYFIMGIDLGQLNILRTGLDMVEISLREKKELSSEERQLYQKILNLKNTICDK
jgi:hypothetical protein